MRGLLLLPPLLLAGCVGRAYDAARATEPYPFDLHVPASIDVQVFREGTELVLVNATPRSYAGARLWINQRFVRDVPEIPAGGTVRLALDRFHDVRGQTFRAGGFFSADEPMPVRLVQIQTADDEPLVGLVVIEGDAS